MRKYEIDMCHGPLFRQIVSFSLPLMATYILQLLFNAADLVVIGHYAHHNAMAAIGATLSLNGLVLNLFGGLSIGTNVIAARAFGENDPETMRKTVGTSFKLALVGGCGLLIVGMLVAKPLLVLMKTPEEILPLSCKYLWICFGAIPFIMIYNFCCAILRAVGDTKRPLFFLIISGIVNVVLNLFFVIVCGMDVAGVALATAASHGVAAALIVWTLIKSKEAYALRRKYVRMDWAIFREILKIGLPAGIQSSCFAISNMTIQSSINGFGSMAMAGNTAAVGLEGIVYVCSFAYHQSAISFTAQNLGGRQFKRILRSMVWCYLCVIVSCSVMAYMFLAFGKYTLAVFNPEPEVIRWGLLRMKVVFTTYALCGFMDVASGGLRGIGYSLTSTIVSLMGTCGFRIWWVKCIFPNFNTMDNLMLSYPISWALVALVNTTLLLIFYRKMLCDKCRIATPWLGMKPGMQRGLRYLVNSK